LGDGPTTAPAAPTGLSASPASSSQINLSWTSASGAVRSGGAGGPFYKIQRSPDGSTGWTEVGTSAYASPSFTDSGLTAATTYYYRVLANNGVGDSPPSTVASAITGASLASMQSPQGYWVGAHGGDGYDLFGWNGGGASDLVSLPKSTLVLDQGARFQWSSSTTAAQALESPDTTFHRAATLYDSAQVRLHLSFPAAYSGVLRLYVVDWDTTARRETIIVNDGSISGPQTATLSSAFDQGAWVSAPITVTAGGSVTVTVTSTAGANAILSGIFLG
jgi:hypothetical protein